MVESFARSAAMREEQERRLRFERKREEARASSKSESADTDLIEVAVVLVMATESQIATLRADIERYQAATIEALHQNEIDLLAARQKVEEMLEKAYELPDGRRVFKTEDGLHVFDENGNEIPTEEIDPAEIGDLYTKWEEYQSGVEELERLEAEREALLAYQAKLDEASERLDNGELTQGEFDALQADLIDGMPAAVREQLPELGGKSNDATAAPSTPLKVSDDMLPTYAGPSPG